MATRPTWIAHAGAIQATCRERQIRYNSEAGWEARIAAVRTGGIEAVRDAVVARFLSAAFRARRPDVTQAVSAMLTGTDPVGYIAACAALRDANLRAAVPSIRASALIIVGALDEATPPADAEALHNALAGSELLILPDAAHLANIEQPEAFTAALLAFLSPTP